MKPDKLQVGLRLKEAKEALGFSLTEFGERLGLKKTTINSYVRGANLAPLDIIEKVSKLYDKPIGWFYFGTIHEYLRMFIDYLGRTEYISEHPEFIKELEKRVLADYPSLPLNEFEYPEEDYIYEEFSELFDEYMKQDIRKGVLEYLENKENLPDFNHKELVDLITYEIFDAYSFSGMKRDFSKEHLFELLPSFVESKLTNEEISIEYSDENILGKLINCLQDEYGTYELINILSTQLIEKEFSSFRGSHELVHIFQSIRPNLIQLYLETSGDEKDDWHRE